MNPSADTRAFPVCSDCLRAPLAHSADYFCAQCKTPFQNRFPLDFEGRCALCRAGARGFDAAYCYGFYDGPLRELIHLLKYDGMTPLAGPAGRLSRPGLAARRGVRRRRAGPLALVSKISAWIQSGGASRRSNRKEAQPPGAARRAPRSSHPDPDRIDQRQAPAECRRGFPIAARTAVEGLRILLVDDVMTTGSTGSACASALKRAGAKSVTLLTVARVDRRSGQPAEFAKYQTAGAS